MSANSLSLRNTALANVGTKIAKNCDLILADGSGSMLSPAQNGKPKIDCLVSALAVHEDRIGILGFSSAVYECSYASEVKTSPEFCGGTNLTGALVHAEQLEPMHILVVSDGEPDSKKSALEVAARIAKDCQIDTLFIGKDSDHNGIAFMRELAQIGRGRFSKFDLEGNSPLLLESKIAGLLAGPADSVIKL